MKKVKLNQYHVSLCIEALDSFINNIEEMHNTLGVAPEDEESLIQIAEMKQLKSKLNKKNNNSKIEIEKVAEWCNHCEHEVELINNFTAQPCSNCGVVLLPCAQCITMDCNNCPFEKGGTKMKKYRIEVMIEPVYLEVSAHSKDEAYEKAQQLLHDMSFEEIGKIAESGEPNVSNVELL